MTLDPSQQFVLGFMALTVAGFCIGAWSWRQAIRADASTHAATLRAARQADEEYWNNLLAATESDTDRECARFRAELDRSGL